MKTLSIILLLLTFASCMGKNTDNNNENSVDTNKLIVVNKTEVDASIVSSTEIEVMQEEDILFNGELTRCFTIRDFERVFSKADSIKQLSDEEPCTFFFDTELEDDNNNLEEFKYYYKEGSRFELYKEKMAVDEFRFSDNKYIIYKGVKLDSSSNTEDLKRLFPNAVNNIGNLDVYDEGTLQVIQLREDEGNISDGHINIFFKNGKLYFMHWWFPC